MVQVVSWLAVAEGQAHLLREPLRERCGITASDVMVSFTQNTDDDRSFGNGRAQLVTGEL